MAFKMNGFDPGKGTGLNTRKINKAKRLTRKNVGHTTVDSPTYGTKKSNRKFPRSEKKMNKAVDLLRNQGYSEEEIEQFTGATGYKDAMDWATEPMVTKKGAFKKKDDTKIGKLFTKAKAKIKNYITDKKLEGFEKYRSEKLKEKYVPTSKKNKSPMKKNNDNKRRLKEVKSSIRDLKIERIKKIGNKRAQDNLKSAIAGLKEKKKQLKNK